MKTKNKQTRGKRGSREQKTFLISFMEDNIDFAHEKFEGETGIVIHNDKWTELAYQLNEIGDCQKTSEKWKQYWRDLKRSCRLKSAHHTKFDDLETRIINITIPDLVLKDECESQERVVNMPASFQISKQNSDVITTDPPKMSETLIKRRKIHEDKDNLLVKATRTMAEMSKITTLPDSEDEIATFGKFIISELRGIIANGDQIVYRQAKRKIQHVLMNTWDAIDSLPCASTRNAYFSDNTNTSQWDDHNVEECST